MSTSSEKKSTQLSQNRETINENEKEEKKSQIEDLLAFLREKEHVAKAYPEIGLVVGVCFKKISNTRSVHVSLTNVLDLNSCDLPKMAMQKEILEYANRDLKEIFEDLELDERMESKAITTPFGTAEFEVLKSTKSSEKYSLVRETRMNYVVSSEILEKESYSWFCEPKHVLNLQDFSLSRRSDVIAKMPAIRSAVSTAKWDSLEDGFTKGWTAFLTALVGLAGLTGTLYSLFVGGLGWIPAVILASIGGVLAIWNGVTARKKIESFGQRLAKEEEKMSEIGDFSRTKKQLREKADTFEKIKSINFVTSTLASKVIENLKNSRIKNAAEVSGVIIEECATRSSTKRSSVPDDGLALFLGLFEEFEANLSDDEYEDLAISYAGLSGEVSDERDALISYMGDLYPALSKAGLIDPELVERIYDSMNLLGGAAYLDEEIESDIPEELAAINVENGQIMNRISAAGISDAENETDQDEEDSGEDELEVTGPEIADSRLRGSPLERRSSKDASEEDS
ncbi:MAG: hypothetical protein GF309_16895 [Candidatus Lokiarchaeota archaeon]|nr:hypothetical protein [Candidatus Lokiarchaeota archaeon]